MPRIVHSGRAQSERSFLRRAGGGDPLAQVLQGGPHADVGGAFRGGHQRRGLRQHPDPGHPGGGQLYQAVPAAALPARAAQLVPQVRVGRTAMACSAPGEGGRSWYRHQGFGGLTLLTSRDVTADGPAGCGVGIRVPSLGDSHSEITRTRLTYLLPKCQRNFIGVSWNLADPLIAFILIVQACATLNDCSWCAFFVPLEHKCCQVLLTAIHNGPWTLIGS